MHFFRRFALFLTLGLPAMPVAIAQSSSSSSNPTQVQSPDQNSQSSASRANHRRDTGTDQRATAHPVAPRAASRPAIHDAYDHKWESFADMGYQRFQPGPSLQRTTFYGWETASPDFPASGWVSRSTAAVTTAQPRRYQYVQSGRFHPAQNQPVRCSVRAHLSLLPATQVLHRRPRHGRLGIWQLLRRHQRHRSQPPGGLYNNANTFAVSASVVAEYNLSPNVGFRLAPEYFATGFGSTLQTASGLPAGLSSASANSKEAGTKVPRKHGNKGVRRGGERQNVERISKDLFHVTAGPGGTKPVS